MIPIRFSPREAWCKDIEPQVARRVHEKEYYGLWRKVFRQVVWNESINIKLLNQK